MKVYFCLLFLVSPSLSAVATEYFREFFGNYSEDVPALRSINTTPGCYECPKVYYPICGDDNVTYINECRMTCYNEHKRTQGEKAKFVRTGPCEVFPEFD